MPPHPPPPAPRRGKEGMGSLTADTCTQPPALQYAVRCALPLPPARLGTACRS